MQQVSKILCLEFHDGDLDRHHYSPAIVVDRIPSNVSPKLSN